MLEAAFVTVFADITVIYPLCFRPFVTNPITILNFTGKLEHPLTLCWHFKCLSFADIICVCLLPSFWLTWAHLSCLSGEEKIYCHPSSPSWCNVDAIIELTLHFFALLFIRATLRLTVRQCLSWRPMYFKQPREILQGTHKDQFMICPFANSTPTVICCVHLPDVLSVPSVKKNGTWNSSGPATCRF